MDSLLSKVSKMLSDNYTIVPISNSTQNVVSRESTILWNNEPLSIDKDTYKQFKDAIKDRGSLYYNKSEIMHYSDFCICLLCSTNYSLNHTCVESIESRAFVAAWRGMTVVSNTATDSVKCWINKYMSDRTAEGYVSTFSIGRQPQYMSRLDTSRETALSNKEDQDIIESLTFNDETVINVDNIDLNLDRVSSIPETQLDILRVVHDFAKNTLL